MSLRKAKDGDRIPERQRRSMGNNIKNTTNLNRETGKYEAVLGGCYWHEEYSNRIVMQPCEKHPKGVRFGKLIIIGFNKSGYALISTEGHRKLKREPNIKEIPERCHNVAWLSKHYLNLPVAEWKFEHDKLI